MHRIHFMAALSLQLIVSFAVCAQHVPQTPYLPGNDAPNWVRLMYGDDASPEVVRSAFEAFYECIPFVKNRDTQYYKRWMRNHKLTSPQPSRGYTELHQAASERMNGIWEEMGPWSYDPEVAMAFQVQSPGACHVYTVEQAKSNHESWGLLLPAGICTVQVEGQRALRWIVR